MFHRHRRRRRLMSSLSFGAVFVVVISFVASNSRIQMLHILNFVHLRFARFEWFRYNSLVRPAIFHHMNVYLFLLCAGYYVHARSLYSARSIVRKMCVEHWNIFFSSSSSSDVCVNKTNEHILIWQITAVLQRKVISIVRACVYIFSFFLSLSARIFFFFDRTTTTITNHKMLWTK